ncbi:competence protein ComEA [Nocardioides daedukensis]|uniref:Competence protein ComEA n=1 Tax=Nocardioides daedukensis TaxID=634462 RepID=A0A7Y9S432_9ACTN|nr:ComEA family DNA-binding protein [Nocardioides daedukensis]NYG60649.1 competence protein ComEA [Nocardioides daedukensis]
MRSRGQSPAHAEAVSRRLALLSAELQGYRGAQANETPTRTPGSVDPEISEEDVDDDGAWAMGELVPFPQEEAHTRIRRTAEQLPAETPAAVEHRFELPRATPPEESTGESTGNTTGLAPPPPIPPAGRHAARRGGWLDASAFRGRVSLNSSHVAVLAVIAAVAMAVTTWWVLRDDPGTPIKTTNDAPALVSGAPGEPAASGVVGPDGAAATPVTELVVDVSGKVRRPGIVILPPGSRVVDAIKAAGGIRKGADLTGLNQARALVDGEQVVVGVPPPPGQAASAAPAPGQPGSGDLVNLNTATASQLEELPGVGPVTAQAIVGWRESNGGFRAVDQLLEVDGIGEKTLAQLAPHVTV